MGVSNRTKTTVNISDVPTTTTDMTKLFSWKHGDTVYGTRAKNHPGMLGYINDINKDYGTEKNKKTKYINTFEPIGPQLKNL